MEPTPDDELDALLAEQVSYYRARAPEYFEDALDISPKAESAVRRELLAALATFPPAGDVLELACGPGTWTGDLLAFADTVTALDSSPEMLALAREAVPDPRVTFVQADLFEWTPDRRYDAVFFGFWLSHVPLERFEQFWALVAACLKPGGRVVFIDDGYRTSEELIEGPESSIIERKLSDGSAFRAVKVPHAPAELERRLTGLGWRITVGGVAPLFWGAGSRA